MLFVVESVVVAVAAAARGLLSVGTDEIDLEKKSYIVKISTNIMILKTEESEQNRAAVGV